MHIKWIALLVVGALTVPLAVHAQPLDAPTGTYSGTLVHERIMTLRSTDPQRVVSFKKKTKLAGFGFVPDGGTRTRIELIMPPGNHTDAGTDRRFVLDFTPDPPTFQIFGGSSPLVVGFPSFAVDGNVVTVTTSLSGSSDGGPTTDDRGVLRVKRTKP
jgi:hypothetical protein